MLAWDALGRRKKKVVGEKAGTELEDSRESDVGRAGWMDRFISMKVSHPNGVKPATSQTDMEGRQTGTIEKVASPRRPIRTVGVEAKKGLNDIVSCLIIMHVLADT